jgi:GTPase SAR1 family protein
MTPRLFQDAFIAMRDTYYKTGDGFLLVFSLTDSSSVEDIKERFKSLLFKRVRRLMELIGVVSF